MIACASITANLNAYKTTTYISNKTLSTTANEEDILFTLFPHRNFNSIRYDNRCIYEANNLEYMADDMIENIIFYISDQNGCICNKCGICNNNRIMGGNIDQYNCVSCNMRYALVGNKSESVDSNSFNENHYLSSYASFDISMIEQNIDQNIELIMKSITYAASHATYYDN
jgi:hypothetical protein